MHKPLEGACGKCYTMLNIQGLTLRKRGCLFQRRGGVVTMRMKRIFTAALTAALISTLFVMPVSAHGHGHHRQARTVQTVQTVQTVNTTDTVNTECPVCTVEGCTETGRHTHDGYDYCGYNHADGYCDGSCATVSASGSTTSGCGYRGGRHGCH